jgi:hypothetical protein
VSPWSAASRAALDPTDPATPELNDQEQENVADAHFMLAVLQCGLDQYAAVGRDGKFRWNCLKL